jgi:hypothetical protein
MQNDVNENHCLKGFLVSVGFEEKILFIIVGQNRMYNENIFPSSMLVLKVSKETFPTMRGPAAP